MRIPLFTLILLHAIASQSLSQDPAYDAYMTLKLTRFEDVTWQIARDETQTLPIKEGLTSWFKSPYMELVMQESLGKSKIQCRFYLGAAPTDQENHYRFGIRITGSSVDRSAARTAIYSACQTFDKLLRESLAEKRALLLNEKTEAIIQLQKKLEAETDDSRKNEFEIQREKLIDELFSIEFSIDHESRFFKYTAPPVISEGQR